MAKLGWIGMGDIGAPMVVRLQDAGHQIVVWGRNRDRLKPALEKGAVEAHSPAEIASVCEAVFLCVTDTDAVEKVVFGPSGVAEGASAGKLLIDHSTIHPERSRKMASRLREEKGMGWVDAPVTGGSIGAREGTLTILIGGEATEVERCRPWMCAYGRKITHMGPSSFGQLTKSCNQAVFFTTLAIWAETLNYAKRVGLDPAKMVDALEGGYADSPVRRVHVPIMISANFPHHSAKLMLKDSEILNDMARITNSPMPVSATVLSLIQRQIDEGHEMTGPMGLIKLYSDKPLTGKEK